MDNDSFIRGLVNVFIAADLAVMWASMAFVGLMVVGGARDPSPGGRGGSRMPERKRRPVRGMRVGWRQVWLGLDPHPFRLRAGLRLAQPIA